MNKETMNAIKELEMLLCQEIEDEKDLERSLELLKGIEDLIPE